MYLVIYYNFFFINNNDQEKLTFIIFITTALRMGSFCPHEENLMRVVKELLVVDILLDLISLQ